MKEDKEEEASTAEAKARLEELGRQRAHELAVERIRAEAARASATAAAVGYCQHPTTSG
mgnify:CR=1 FL=1